MTTIDHDFGDTAVRLKTETSRDHDEGKGAMEDDRTTVASNPPGLDDDGMPNDATAIAQDAIGARSDGSQG